MDNAERDTSLTDAILAEAEVETEPRLPIHDLPGTALRTRVGSPNGNPARSNVVQIEGNLVAVKRGRGRPRKIEMAPTRADLEYHAEMAKEKAEFIESDELVTTVGKRADAFEVFRVIKQELARETASLKFQRIEDEKRGRDTAQVSSRRIDALTKVAHIEFEMKKIGADMFDLKGEKFQKVFKLWIDTLQEVATEVLTPEVVDLFFNRIATAMENWEEKAAEAVK